MNIRSHRKPLTAVVLGAWLFALFVGIAHACLPETDVGPGAAQGMAMPSDSGHDDQSVNCLQFCANDTPVFSKLQLVADQPTNQPLLVGSVRVTLAPTPVDAVGVVHLAHPPPDVPVLLRSLRLAL